MKRRWMLALTCFILAGCGPTTPELYLGATEAYHAWVADVLLPKYDTHPDTTDADRWSALRVWVEMDDLLETMKEEEDDG